MLADVEDAHDRRIRQARIVDVVARLDPTDAHDAIELGVAREAAVEWLIAVSDQSSPSPCLPCPPCFP